MQRLLEGKAGVVIGASSGIGKAAAALFAEEGAKVAVAARRRDRLDALVAQITDAGGEATPITADVTHSGDHNRIVAETLAAFGRFDFAFNNAGTAGNFVPMLEQSEEDWDRTIDVNLKSVWMSVRAQAAQMITQGNGAIVNTSSWLSTGALPGSTSYSASKGGMDGLLRAAALELAPHGVRINNINPGGVDTKMTREALQHNEELLDAFGGSHPIGRLGTPYETAQLAAFLLSDRAANMTGQTVLIDGGYAIPGQRNTAGGPRSLRPVGGPRDRYRQDNRIHSTSVSQKRSDNTIAMVRFTGGSSRTAGEKTTSTSPVRVTNAVPQSSSIQKADLWTTSKEI